MWAGCPTLGWRDLRPHWQWRSRSDRNCWQPGPRRRQFGAARRGERGVRAGNAWRGLTSFNVLGCSLQLGLRIAIGSIPTREFGGSFTLAGSIASQTSLFEAVHRSIRRVDTHPASSHARFSAQERLVKDNAVREADTVSIGFPDLKCRWGRPNTTLQRFAERQRQ